MKIFWQGGYVIAEFFHLSSEMGGTAITNIEKAFQSKILHRTTADQTGRCLGIDTSFRKKAKPQISGDSVNDGRSAVAFPLHLVRDILHPHKRFKDGSGAAALFPENKILISEIFCPEAGAACKGMILSADQAQFV